MRARGGQPDGIPGHRVTAARRGAAMCRAASEPERRNGAFTDTPGRPSFPPRLASTAINVISLLRGHAADRGLGPARRATRRAQAGQRREGSTMRPPVSETSGPVPRLRHLGLAVVLIAALGLEAGCG